MAQDLTGLTALVTGGGSGIGKAIALNFAGARMNIVIADREGDRAEAVAKEVQAMGVDSLAVTCDVGDPAAVENLAEQSYAEFGQVNILCNNAGVAYYGPVAEASQEDWDWLFHTNFWGVVNGVRTFVPRMRAQSGGFRHIVNTASGAGLFSISPLGLYNASKYAVVALSETLRAEVAGEGIGVSVLCPATTLPSRIGETARGPQVTEQTAEALQFEDDPELPGLMGVSTPDQVAANVHDAVLGNRLYVFSYAPMRAAVERRFTEIMSCFDAVLPDAG